MLILRFYWCIIVFNQNIGDLMSGFVIESPFILCILGHFFRVSVSYLFRSVIRIASNRLDFSVFKTHDSFPPAFLWLFSYSAASKVWLWCFSNFSSKSCSMQCKLLYSSAVCSFSYLLLEPCIKLYIVIKFSNFLSWSPLITHFPMYLKPCHLFSLWFLWSTFISS